MSDELTKLTNELTRTRMETGLGNILEEDDKEAKPSKVDLGPILNPYHIDGKRSGINKTHPKLSPNLSAWLSPLHQYGTRSKKVIPPVAPAPPIVAEYIPQPDQRGAGLDVTTYDDIVYSSTPAATKTRKSLVIKGIEPIPSLLPLPKSDAAKAKVTNWLKSSTTGEKTRKSESTATTVTTQSRKTDSRRSLGPKAGTTTKPTKTAAMKAPVTVTRSGRTVNPPKKYNPIEEAENRSNLNEREAYQLRLL